jgi:hypothetical protein
MRHTPVTIRQFLTDQPHSGLTIAEFCQDNDLKIPTFYSWKKKYGGVNALDLEGFCKITPKLEKMERSLCMPSGLRFELTGLTTTEIAEVILEIDRAYV